jgi:hypothetical protein
MKGIHRKNLSMSHSTISREEETNDSACFEGFNLDLLGALRRFFLSYNLTIIENPKSITSCLYHVIVGTPKQITIIAESSSVKAKKLILISINGSREENLKLKQQFNAVVARITHKQITSAESRVIFGSLFDDRPNVIVVHEETLLDPKATVSTISPDHKHFLSLDSNKEINQIPETNRKPDTNFVKATFSSTWDQRQASINRLIQQMYPTLKQTNQNISKLWLIFRYVFVLLFLFLLTHFFLLVVSILLLINISLNSNKILLQVTSLSLKSSAITGQVILQPLHLVVSQTSFDRALVLFDRISTIIDKSLEIKTNLSNNYFVFPNSGQPTVIIFQQLIQQWRLIAPDIQLLISELKELQETNSFPWNIPQVKKHLSSNTNTLLDYKNTADTVVSAASLLEELLTYKKNLNILLLFQNNREIRPSGGFVGSVGFLTITDGSINDFTINDVYDIDGQLKGHITPPNPISTIIGQEHWYLRDSNWSADFQTTAKEALRFLEASVNKQADVVVGITLPVLEDILKITGDITLPGTSTVISADTIFQYIYIKTRDDFFPGSSAKKDTLSAIASGIIAAIDTLKDEQRLLLARTIARRLEGRDIQLMSVDEGYQQEIVSRDFGGVFPKKAPCYNSQNSCFQDIFALVEANLGMNKTNYLIDRFVEREVVIEKTELLRADTIRFVSNVNPSSIAGGHYTSYHRVYYPTGTTINSISLNDVPIQMREATNSAVLLPYAELLNEFPGVVSVGIAMDVPPGETGSLLIRTRQPLVTNPKTYSLWVFKQAGVEGLPFSFSLAPLRGTKAISSYYEPLLLAKGSKISYNSMLQRDKNLILSLQSEDQ